MSVSVCPGASALQRIPVPENRMAMFFVIVLTAALLVV